MEREEIQKNALLALKATKGNCTLDITMRVGKTKIALDYISYVLNLKGDLFSRVLWICDSTKERDIDVKEEAKKWNIDISRVDLVHWKSIHTVDNQDDYILIIFNECQNITPNLCGYLHGFKKAKIVGMTGTYPRFEKAKLLKELKLDRIAFRYDLDEAAEDGVISDYEIEVVEIPMSGDKVIDVTYDGGTFKTSEISSYENLSKKIDDAKTASQEKFMRLLRMKAVNKFPSKIYYTQQILIENAKKGLKTLVFAQDNKHALVIGKNVYSSKTDDKVLQKFESGEISYMILINKGGTGYTYKTPIDHVILLAPHSNNTILQKSGRGAIKNKSGKLKITVPISKDTVQKKWVQSAFKDLDQKKIKYL